VKASELETDFWQRSLAQYYYPSGNFLADGYAPPGGEVADFTVAKKGDTYHLFHIERRVGGNCAWPGHEIYFGHSSTQDFETWERHRPVLLVEPGAWDGEHVYAPFVYPHDGWFYMFYTGLNSLNSQQIGLALSDDLMTWSRYEANPVLTPRDFDWAFWSESEACSCRDPHVVKIGDLFHLYYTAVTRDGNGCVAVATSKDLVHWTDGGPVNTIIRDSDGLNEGSNHLETACVFDLGSEFVLFYNHMRGVRINRSSSPYEFGDAAGPIVWANVSGLERIAADGESWLVAGFDNATGRFVLGILDWTQPEIKVQRITTGSQIESFLSKA